MSKNPVIEKFLKACKEGEIETVKNMLSIDQTLLTAKDNQGRSGFAIALLAGNQDIGNFL